VYATTLIQRQRQRQHQHQQGQLVSLQYAEPIKECMLVLGEVPSCKYPPDANCKMQCCKLGQCCSNILFRGNEVSLHHCMWWILARGHFPKHKHALLNPFCILKLTELVLLVLPLALVGKKVAAYTLRSRFLGASSIFVSRLVVRSLYRYLLWPTCAALHVDLNVVRHRAPSM